MMAKYTPMRLYTAILTGALLFTPASTVGNQPFNSNSAHGQPTVAAQPLPEGQTAQEDPKTRRYNLEIRTDSINSSAAQPTEYQKINPSRNERESLLSRLREERLIPDMGPLEDFIERAIRLLENPFELQSPVNFTIKKGSDFRVQGDNVGPIQLNYRFELMELSLSVYGTQIDPYFVEIDRLDGFSATKIYSDSDHPMISVGIDGNNERETFTFLSNDKKFSLDFVETTLSAQNDGDFSAVSALDLNGFREAFLIIRRQVPIQFTRDWEVDYESMGELFLDLR